MNWRDSIQRDAVSPPQEAQTVEALACCMGCVWLLLRLFQSFQRVQCSRWPVFMFMPCAEATY
eukprot:508376-Amphidinium_carterae.1